MASQCVCFTRVSASILDLLRVFLRMGSKCVYFTRLSVSFKTPYAFSSVWRHNACLFHVFLHSRFFIRFKTPYVFSSVWLHNACVSLAFICIVLGRLSAFSSVLRSQCVCFSRFSALAFLHLLRRLIAFYSVRRHNACDFSLAFLHSRFFII